MIDKASKWEKFSMKGSGSAEIAKWLVQIMCSVIYLEAVIWSCTVK